MHLNRQNATGIKKTLKEGKLTFHRFEEITFIKDLSNDLACLDLINGYFFYVRDSHTANFNFRSINYTLTRLEDSVIARHQLGQAQIVFLLDFIDQLVVDMDKLESKTRELLSLVVIHLAKLKGKGFVYGVYSPKKEVVITQAEKDSELQKLLQDYPI